MCIERKSCSFVFFPNSKGSAALVFTIHFTLFFTHTKNCQISLYLHHTTYFPISSVTVTATVCSPDTVCLLKTLPQSIFSNVVNYWASFINIIMIITNVYQFHSNVRDDDMSTAISASDFSTVNDT